MCLHEKIASNSYTLAIYKENKTFLFYPIQLNQIAKELIKKGVKLSEVENLDNDVKLSYRRYTKQ